MRKRALDQKVSRYNILSHKKNAFQGMITALPLFYLFLATYCTIFILYHNHTTLLSAKKMHFQALITALLLIPLVANSLPPKKMHFQALITALLSLSFYY
jgi:hypothetical protein